jgi:ribonucleoside-diphosphate reductase alpha chain
LKTCSSFIDAIFRDLAVNYLGRDDLAHVQPADVVDVTEPEPEHEDGPQPVAPLPGKTLRIVSNSMSA